MEHENELKNLEIEEDEVLTVKLVTRKFKRKALKVHSDKTGTMDDEEFKQLLNDYNKVKNALNELSEETNEEDTEQSDLQNFFEQHNFAKEFSQSWTIFVEKEKVNEWKKELLVRYPNHKELQGNGTQYKAPVDDMIISITFYNVDIPKMNIQGDHQCIRKFVLDILPEIYRTVKEFLENVPVDAPKLNVVEDLSTNKCDICSRVYKKKSTLDKHIKLKHSCFDLV